jgi:hypothetical protein
MRYPYLIFFTIFAALECRKQIAVKELTIFFHRRRKEFSKKTLLFPILFILLPLPPYAF